MNRKDKIKKEIEIQKSIEGTLCQYELLLGFLEIVKTQEQWNDFVNVKHHHYGVRSYQTHRFYYPKDTLVRMINWAKQQP